MRPERYHAEDLISLLRQRKIATMDDSKRLWAPADATVFRKLAGLDYRTSYSHRGRYYTLDEIARFDELGLWSFRPVWFSRFGTLVATVEALVAARGWLRRRRAGGRVARGGQGGPVGAGPQRRLARHQVSGRYVYLLGSSLDPPGPAGRPVGLRQPGRPASLGPGCGCCPMSSRPPSCCSTACSTNASADCTPAWRPSRWVTAGMPRSPSCWASTPLPWPGVGGNCWPATSSRAGCVALAPAGRPPQKDPRGHRPDRPADGTRDRRRSRQRYQMDPADHREDR